MTDFSVGDKVKIVIKGEVGAKSGIGVKIKGFPNTTYLAGNHTNDDFIYTIEKIQKPIEVGDVVEFDSHKYLVGKKGLMKIQTGVFYKYYVSFDEYWEEETANYDNLGPIK